MKPQEFIINLKQELELRSDLYLDPEQQTEIFRLIQSLNLNASQSGIMKEIVNLLLQETAYGLFCGIEGTASIGSIQEQFKLISESGDSLTGALDSIFYEEILEKNNT